MKAIAPSFYVVEVFLSLQSIHNNTKILVNEITDMVTDKDKAVMLAKDVAENYYTPNFVTDAVNDVVVRAAYMKDGRIHTTDEDIWSAAAERVLAWQVK